MAATLTVDTFKYKFVNGNGLISVKKITEICFVWSSQQYFSIDSDNGLVSIKQQAIIWTNDGIVYWRIYASLDLNELTHSYHELQISE